MDNNYVTYHLHTSLSLLDSCTNYQDYIARAVELGQKAIAFTEHGNIYRWVAKKMACDKAGIKYIHGVEVYMTLDLNPMKVRDNYHTVLLAKNYEGVKEINTLISNSYQDDHMYYKPRITFEEFANISDNVIKISACVGGPLCAIDNVIKRIQEKEIPATKNPERIQALEEYIKNIQPWKEKLYQLYDFLEIQYHNDDTQIAYNKLLWQKSNEYGKPLIAGTDTHSLNDYKAECRRLLMEAKDIQFSDDDSNEQEQFDLTYKTYDELVRAFELQDSIPKMKYMEAINNTNKLIDMVEDFELDMAFKYPIVSDNDVLELRNRLNKSFNRLKAQGIITPENRQQYIDQVNEEIRVFEKIDMCGFMISMADLIGWCKENGLYVGPGRGSCAGSTVAYMLGITDVDPQVWGTIFSRFANEDRKEIGDIDCDFAPNDREKVYNHIIEQFGQNKTGYILAITTVKEKGVVDELGRALHNREKRKVAQGQLKDSEMKYSLDYIRDLKNQYESTKTKLSATIGDEKELIAATVEEMKKVDSDIFEYFLGILNNPVAQSMHPAGMVISPITLPDNYGVMYRNGLQILQLDMEDVHETGLVKYDILGLKNVQIIKDTCDLAGISYPLAHEIDWNDQDVWNDMLKTNIGLFQFESAFAFDSLKKFKPMNIADMSLVTAAIRPSGASYRDKLFNKELGVNPSPIIDDLLKENYRWLIYQEDIIAFLQKICGLSGSEADNLRRAIARKQKDRMDAALPKVIDGYCNKSDQPREVAEQEVKQYIQVIEDASEYMFGKNHSFAYCMIGYLCAYYRYHYTPQFIVAYLNNAQNDDDIKHGFELARLYGYNVEPPRFRHARANYSYDGDKSIHKGLSSVKWLNEAATEYLYTLKDIEFKSFVDLLAHIKETGSGQIDSRKIEILIKLNFFEEFGGNKKLMQVYEIFNKLYGSKQFSRSKLPVDEDLLLRYATKATDKTIFMDGGFKTTKDLIPRPEKFGKGEKKEWEAKYTVEVTYYNVDCTDENEPSEPRVLTLLRDYECSIPNEFYGIKEQMEYDKEYYGYVNMKYDVHNSYCFVQEVDQTYSPKVTLYSLGAGKTLTFKVQKQLFQSKPIKTNEAIVVLNYEEKPRWTRTEDGKFVPRSDGSTETWLTDYTILTQEQWQEVVGEKYGEVSSPSDYERYMIYDLETGGFNGSNSDILEVGYMVCERTNEGFKEISRDQFLVHTDNEITNSNIHGITNDMCDKDGIDQRECIDRMMKFFSDKKTLVLGYNILGFDNKFFTDYAYKITGERYTIINDILDLQPVIKDRLNVQKGFKLENAVAFYNINGREQAHRAMSDVVDTFNVANAYINEGKDIDKWIKKGML